MYTSNKPIKMLGTIVAILIAAAMAQALEAATLDFISPAGGEVWTAGTTVSIDWVITDANVDIIYLEKGGERCECIHYYFYTMGTHIDWEVVSTFGDGDNYTIRIVATDLDGNTLEVVSTPFTITGSPVPTFELTYPIGGEILIADSVETITWDTTNPAGAVYVDLYKAGQCERTLGYAPMSAGQLEWDICQAMGNATDYSIVISADHCGPYMESLGGEFAIEGSSSPWLEVTAPVGGETLSAGTVQQITWTWGDASGGESPDLDGNFLSIDLLKAGQWYSHIARVPVNYLYYEWEICPSIGDGDDYSVRLSSSDLCGRVVQDQSDVFAIVGSSAGPVVNLTWPMPGDTWGAAGETEQITWESNLAAGNVVIGLMEGGLWTYTLGIVAVEDGLFEYVIPPDLIYGLDSELTIRLSYCGGFVADNQALFGPPSVFVVGRHVFYNDSVFDGNNPAANEADDDAIAADKVALLPGETATFANYISYDKRINGIMIDIANMPGVPVSADFEFEVGNPGTFGNVPWGPGPAITDADVTVRPGEGTGGSDRVTIIFTNPAPNSRWLRVTMLANANTGLDADDVHYWGLAIGESGDNPLNALVNATDEIGARNNPCNIRIGLATIENNYDYSRDKSVGSTDETIARNNGTNFLTALKLITAP